MNTNELKTAIRAAVAMKRPLMIWGQPGIGKSMVVQEVAQEHGRCIDFRAPMHDTVDMMGLPSTENGRTVWNRPDFIPTDGEGILFIDELPQASPAMQAALSQLILDRRCGSHKLGDGWSIVAAGNRQTDKCGTHRMLEHIKSRMIHVALDVDVNAWCQWAIANNIKPEVIGFIRFKSDALASFDPSKNERAYPCPRAWQAVSELLSVKTNGGESTPENMPNVAQKRLKGLISGNIEHELIAGTVGDGTAADFMAYLQLARELPNPDAVLLDPMNAQLPESPGAKWAIATTLAMRATVDNFQAVLQYVTRLGDEFSVLTVCSMSARKEWPELCTTQAFTLWSIENKDVLT